jgi:hypothetical protein
MRIAMYEGEEKLSELARRLFRLKGVGASGRARRAEAALIEANPNLRNLDEVHDGTLLVVPDTADLELSEEIAPGGAARDTARIVEASLEGVAESLDVSASSLAESATNQLKLLRSSRVTDLAKKDRRVRKRVDAALEAAEADRSRAKEMKTEQTAALKELRADLKDFLDLHS